MPTPGGFEQSVYVLPTVADINAITVAEIAAGVQIEVDMPNPVSFSGTTNYMDTSTIASRQDQSEAGTYTPDQIEFEVFRRKAAAAVAIPALDDETTYFLVKFEGGNIAGGDHTAPAAADTYDAVEITVGTKSDVDSPRPDPRRMTVPCGVTGTIARDKAVAA